MPNCARHPPPIPSSSQVGSEVPGLWGRRVCAPSKQATDGELAKALWVATEEAIAAALARA